LTPLGVERCLHLGALRTEAGIDRHEGVAQAQYVVREQVIRMR